ncbi:hypothetical protein [Pseudoduganella aquatica]|uniref:hypothetical protein n=1 Tax=Pseudoduganella aquatica TaxID=2660641 RepID=UPI001E618580|nr:hypothetical protein [Pseudoduganella aquatica]
MKLSDIVARLVTGWCIVLLLYGLLTFPDAPFKPCQDGPYCGKGHVTHTEEEYQAFSRWQTLLFVSWPFGLLVAFTRKKKSSAAPPYENSTYN